MNPSSISEELSAKMSNMAFVCALLVVAMHVISMSPVPIRPDSTMGWFDATFRQVLTPVAVPWFFLSAGFFLGGHVNENGWWCKAICKRVRTLLLPYLFWVSFAFLLKRGGTVVINIFHGRMWNEAVDVGIFEVIRAFGLSFESPTPTALWFVRALFLFVLTSPLVVLLLSRVGGVVIVVLSATHLLFLSGVLPNLIGSLDFFFPLHGLIYFAFGIFCRRTDFSPIVALLKRMRGACFLFVLGLICLRLFCLRMGWFHGAAILLACLIPLLMWCLFELMGGRKWPRSLTGISFAIYLIHPFVFHAIYGFAIRTGCRDVSSGTVGGYCFVFIFVSLICIVFGNVLSRIPILKLVLFGGRGG